MSRPLCTHLLVRSRITTGIDYIFALSFQQSIGVLWRSEFSPSFSTSMGRVQSLWGLETDLIHHRRDNVWNNHIDKRIRLSFIAIHSIPFVAIRM